MCLPGWVRRDWGEWGETESVISGRERGPFCECSRGFWPILLVGFGIRLRVLVCGGARIAAPFLPPLFIVYERERDGGRERDAVGDYLQHGVVFMIYEFEHHWPNFLYILLKLLFVKYLKSYKFLIIHISRFTISGNRKNQIFWLKIRLQDQILVKMIIVDPL